MSLIEIMIAISIIVILATTASLTYRAFVPEARQERVIHDLKTLGDALAAHDHDQPDQTYDGFDFSGLIGRYLDHIPADPWGADYIVDPFFRRVVSMGVDGALQTRIPGFDLFPLANTLVSDDPVRSYAVTGRIAFIEGSSLMMMDADGQRVELAIQGLGAGDSANLDPSRSQFVLTMGGNLKILELSGGAGTTYDVLENSNPVKALDPVWSPSGLKFSVIQSDTKAVVVSGLSPVTTGATDGYFIATSAALDDRVTQPRRPQLTPDHRTLIFQNKDDLYRVSAAEASPVTILSVSEDGTPTGDAGVPDLSPDGKAVAYVAGGSGNKVYIHSIVSGKRFLALGAGSGGPTFNEVVWSPEGRRLALTDGTSIYVSPARPGADQTPGSPYPYKVHGGGSISSLSWR